MKLMTASADSPGWKLPFFTIWTGQVFSLLGSYLVQFALVWWVTRTTGSATILATASLVALLPDILLGPFAGALIDRLDRRKVMIVSDLAVALVTLSLVYLFWTGSIQIWHLYVVMTLRSLGNTFHRGAMQASTALMVPRAQLARIAGLNQMLSGGLNIVAPPLGALLMELLPLHMVVAVDVVTALIAVLPMIFIAIPSPRRADGPSGATNLRVLWGDVRMGLRLVGRWPGLLAIIILAMLLNLIISPVFRLLPLLVSQHFGGGALEFAWLDSGWGVGYLAGGVLLGVWGGFKRRVITALTGIVGLGLGVTVVGLAPANALPLAIGGLVFGAVMNSICNGAFMALMQERVDPSLQGRIGAVVSSGCMLMVPLGMAIAGPLADAVSVRYLFLGAGLAQTVIGLISFGVPALMNVEKTDPPSLEELMPVAEGAAPVEGAAAAD